jgi:alcohol dehydrogenase
MNPSAEALVLTAANTLERRTFDLPDVTADTARLRIEACGLCGTDHEQYSGHITAPFSFIPGHEIVGIIDETATPPPPDGTSGRRPLPSSVPLSCRQCEPCARREPALRP